MPKIDPELVELTNRTGYPPPFDEAVAGRFQRRIAIAAGMSELGVSEVTLEPGAWSSQRHWHDGEDEFLVMLEGEALLVEDDGRTVMRAGDLASWPKGTGIGHHLINESERPCRFLAFSAGECSGGGYSDIDMLFTADNRYVHKDGTPY
jgi:uncharacterized cupin superfamily protein